jgi:hypothetical protein
MFIELAVGRTDLVWRLSPQSDLGNLYALEDLIVQPNPDPSVIVLGTSRGRGAFLPTEMERVLRLPRGGVLNLAMGGFQIFDALVTYERNRVALKGADLAVIQVDPFQFSIGRNPSARFRQLAGWKDRLAYHGLVRAGLIRDMVFGTDNVQPTLVDLRRKLLSDGRLPEPVGVDEFGRLAVVLIANDHDARNFTPRAFSYWLDWQYLRYEYSPVFEEQLVRLVTMMQQDGVKPVVVYMPTVADFQSRLRKRPGDPYGHFRLRMGDLGRRHGFPAAFWENAADAGLDERGFRDWGHLNTAGAKTWSVFFASWLQKQSGFERTRTRTGGRREHP